MLDEVKGLFARFGRKDAAATPVPTEHGRVFNPFHAVSIAPGPEACEAAQVRAGKRFLSREAPRLPLAECGNPECRCRYQHHDDRRALRATHIGQGRCAAAATLPGTRKADAVKSGTPDSGLKSLPAPS